MSETFPLLDLPSQALAVERLLSGRPEGQKLSWLGMHGKLTPLEYGAPCPRQSYLFESVLGLRCVFFIVGDELVFFGDNTTYSVKR